MMIRVMAAATLTMITANFSLTPSLALAQQGKLANQHSVCCPNCQAICVLDVKPSKVEKKAFEVECKPICIPRVRFPWQKCDEPACADIKWVRVLTSKKVECEECKYSWRVETLPTPGCSPGCAITPQPASAVTQTQPVGHEALRGPARRVDVELSRNGSARRVSYLPTVPNVALPPTITPSREDEVPVIRVRLRDEPSSQDASRRRQ